MKTVFLKGLCILSLVMIPEAVFSSSKGDLKSVSPHQYTHLIETYQSQTFEPLSQTALFPEQSGSISSFVKIAKVHFLTNNGGITFSASDTTSFTDTTITKCKVLGYTKTSCSSGNPTSICPYNSSYFKECCDAKYKYSQCQYPYSLSQDSCGGKYDCVCDKNLFPVTASSCALPMIPSLVSGNSCVENGVTYVSECVCPATYSETCTGAHLKGKGTGCSKNGTTKYTGCECENGYNLTCSGEGNSPSKPTDFCLKDGVKYYNNCNSCPNKCSLASCPTGVVCEKEECSGKFCDIGCAMTEGYADLDNYWCEGALRCLIK